MFKFDPGVEHVNTGLFLPSFILPYISRSVHTMKLLMHTLALLIITLSRTTTTYNVNAVSIPQNARRSSSQCTPFHSRFEQSDISNSHNASTPFVGVSPQGSYSVGTSGLELYLEKPNHPVKTKDGVNDIVAEGATVNSTFTVQ